MTAHPPVPQRYRYLHPDGRVQIVTRGEYLTSLKWLARPDFRKALKAAGIKPQEIRKRFSPIIGSEA
jgi:hypothetical protein